MTLRGAIAILLFVAVVIGVIGGLFALFGAVFGQESPVLNIFFAVVLPAILAIGAALFRPFQRVLEEFVQANIRFSSKKCRVFLYGPSGSGKTTLIKKLLTQDRLGPEDSTERFATYPGRISLILNDPSPIDVVIADYSGEETGQVIVNPPEEFFGPKGSRIVNVVLLVVDCVPVRYDDRGDMLDDEEMLEWLSSDANSKIMSRVESNLRYLDEWDIQRIFEVAYSERNLFCVRLLINKYDLLEEATMCGYLPEVDIGMAEDYAKKLYEPLETGLLRACRDLSFHDFSVHVISATRGEEARDVFHDALENYKERMG